MNIPHSLQIKKRKHSILNIQIKKQAASIKPNMQKLNIQPLSKTEALTSKKNLYKLQPNRQSRKMYYHNSQKDKVLFDY